MAAKLLFLYLLVVAGLEVACAAPLIPRQSLGTVGTINTGGVGRGNSTTGRNITSALSERVVADLKVARAVPLIPCQSTNTICPVGTPGVRQINGTTFQNITSADQL